MIDTRKTPTTMTEIHNIKITSIGYTVITAYLHKINNMKKLLFPTDYSSTASNALQYAFGFAKQYEYEITLFHVFNLSFVEGSNTPYYQIQTLLADRKLEAAKKLQSIVPTDQQHLVSNHLVEYGQFIGHEIAQLAKKESFDLIIMGTEGDHSIRDKILGSTTTHTMMNAPCPVLAIPPSVTFKPLQQIAYATDFIPTETDAIDQLISFGSEIGADLHMIHVETRHQVLGDQHGTITIDDYRYPFKDFSLIKHESISEGIENYIQQNQIQCLAMYLKRRTLWEYLFHRSVTQKMVFNSKIPLMIFNG